MLIILWLHGHLRWSTHVQFAEKLGIFLFPQVGGADNLIIIRVFEEGNFLLEDDFNRSLGMRHEIRFMREMNTFMVQI